MKLFTLKLVSASLAVFVLFLAYGNGFEGRGSGRRLRVLVDASKDGGTWWFPQGPADFDAKTEHQGKAMADSMRARGWEVVELPRGEVVTPGILGSFDVVIRPTVFFRYSESETTAYREAVSAGTRLLLMGTAGGDAIAEAFGLHFDQRSRIASVKKIIPLSLTVEREVLEGSSAENTGTPVFRVLSIWSNEIPWVPLVEMPQEAVAFAWVEGQDNSENPVLGYYPLNEGYVLFIGSALGIYNQGQEWRDKLLAFLEQDSLSGLQQLSLAPPVAIDAAGPQPPALISPENGDTLPQLSARSWVFRWKPVPGAQKYQIIVLGPGAAYPLADTVTSSSRLTLPQRGGYIVDRNCRGWMWRVRAQDADGQWGSWSDAGRFDVAPLGR